MTGAIAQAPTLTTVFPASPLGQQLQTVARLIAVRDRLAMQRQVFFVATGGFDSHDDQVVNQPDLLGNVSACSPRSMRRRSSSASRRPLRRSLSRTSAAR